YGTINGQPVTSLAQSAWNAVPVTYAQLQTALPGELPPTDPSNGSECYLNQAQAVLLGLAPTGGNDGFIGFNTNFQWSYTHTNDPGKVDFIETALHEITHVLGRT